MWPTKPSSCLRTCFRCLLQVLNPSVSCNRKVLLGLLYICLYRVYFLLQTVCISCLTYCLGPDSHYCKICLVVQYLQYFPSEKASCSTKMQLARHFSTTCLARQVYTCDGALSCAGWHIKPCSVLKPGLNSCRGNVMKPSWLMKPTPTTTSRKSATHS